MNAIKRKNKPIPMINW